MLAGTGINRVEHGGRGVGRVVKRNLVLLGNWIWRLPVNSIWVMVIKSTQGVGANG